MKKIYLIFSKSETRLAGFPYGEAIYKNQVEKNFTLGDEITIVFPKQIEKIASSFVQGFFAVLVTEIGYKGIEEKIIIESGSEKLTSSIWKNIY